MLVSTTELDVEDVESVDVEPDDDVPELDPDELPLDVPDDEFLAPLIWAVPVAVLLVPVEPVVSPVPLLSRT